MRVETLVGEVYELEKRCRDLLQFDAVHERLNSRGSDFDKICAFLDFLGDSNGSILTVSSTERRKGFEPYFLAYGLLEMLYARQRTLVHLLGCFSLAVPDSLRDEAILAPRNHIIGHPLTSDGAAHVIVRNSLTTDGFEYWSYRGPTTTRGQKVVYDELLERHLEAMKDGLSKLLSFLAKIENDRRASMRQQPLGPVLHGLDYVVRCIAAAPIEGKYEFTVDADIVMLEEKLEEIREALLRRMRENEVAYWLDHVIEALRLLKELLPMDTDARRLRFRIVSEGVEHGYRRIVQLVNEIDGAEAVDVPVPTVSPEPAN